MKNIGLREGSACVSASFVKLWAEETPFVHFDIAGTAWTTKPPAHLEGGATGFGLRLTLPPCAPGCRFKFRRSMPTVDIPTKRVIDWASFHDVFSEIRGFPHFYGRNLNAWVDCMTSLDSPGDGMTKIHCQSPDVVVLYLKDVKDFKSRCPEIYDAIIESSAFVNYSRLDQGEPAVLALSFWK